MEKKKPDHYVDNKEFLQHMIEFKLKLAKVEKTWFDSLPKRLTISTKMLNSKRGRRA